MYTSFSRSAAEFIVPHLHTHHMHVQYANVNEKTVFPQHYYSEKHVYKNFWHFHIFVSNVVVVVVAVVVGGGDGGGGADAVAAACFVVTLSSRCVT